jgi:ubiquinone/menaquinone biosynthesis C-methylase UbiE
MPINYQETSRDLLMRIDIHKKFGGRDIDSWMLDLLRPGEATSRLKILDIGCGAGKQCFLYHEACQGNVDIIGGDTSEELLGKARAENQARGNPVKFENLDFNARLPFPDNHFDLVSCCFAIYYAADIPFTIKELHRVLRPGGRLFTTGPMPANKKLFYEVIRDATPIPIPPMPGSSRYESGIVATMRKTFAHVDLHVFENPLTFDTVDPFLEYTRASLSEDRKIWTSLFSGAAEFEALMGQIRTAAEKRLAKDGTLVMTKVVGGAIATK